MPPTTQLALRCEGLTSDVTEQNLRNVFEGYGRVIWLRVKRDSQGKTCGSGYVRILTKHDDATIMEALQGAAIGKGKLKLHRMLRGNTAATSISAPLPLTIPVHSFEDRSQELLALYGPLASCQVAQPSIPLPPPAVSSAPPPASYNARFAIQGITANVREEQVKAIFAYYGIVKSVEFGRRAGKTTGNGAIDITCYEDPVTFQDYLKTVTLDSATLRAHLNYTSGSSTAQQMQARTDLPLPTSFVSPEAITPSSQSVFCAPVPTMVDAQVASDQCLLDDDLLDLTTPGVSPTNTLWSPSPGPSNASLPSTASVQSSQDKPSPPAVDMSGEMTRLRAALEAMDDPNVEQRRDILLGILMMLPRKDRLLCIFNSEYLHVKAIAAIALLDAVPRVSEQEADIALSMRVKQVMQSMQN